MSQVSRSRSRSGRRAALRRARSVWLGMPILVEVFWEEFDEGRWQDALDTALGMTDIGCARGYYLSALVLDAAGQERDADKAARRAASADDPDGLRRWGFALRRRGRLKAAVAALARAARIAPDPVWDALLVDWQYWAGEPSITLEALARAGDVEPFVLITKSYALLDAGRVQEAEQILLSAADAGYSEAWVPLGNIAKSRGDWTRALDLYAHSAATGDMHAVFNAGVIRWEKGERVKAVRLIREAASTDRWARRWLSHESRARKRARGGAHRA